MYSDVIQHIGKESDGSGFPLHSDDGFIKIRDRGKVVCLDAEMP